MRAVDQFVDAITQELGAAPDPWQIIAGKIIRFSTNGKRSDDSGWCKLFEDERGGVFGCWRTGTQHTWRTDIRAILSPRERQQERERIAAAQAARQEEQAQRYA